MNTIFTSIINGEIPAYKVLETEKSLAFLDINPVVAGHTLVIPKTFAENIFDLNEDSMKDLMQTIQNTAKLLKEKLGCSGINIINASGADAQQTVFHLHFHIIPRFPNDGLDMWIGSKNKKVKTGFEEVMKKLKG